MSNIIQRLNQRVTMPTIEEISLSEYLERCRADPLAAASPTERLLHVIGEPEIIDSHKDPTYRRYGRRYIKIYEPFREFHGMYDTVEQIVSFFRFAAQGLEEKKQILYLLGPVGGGKSSLAEKLKELIEKVPFYALKDSPIHESPFGLFSYENDGPILEEEYGISRRYLKTVLSPWAIKRQREYEGDINRFRVVKLYPSITSQIAISKTEPGDENNQDISSLVGKVDIRQLEHYAQHDPDAYSYSGGLCLANRGLLEFVEMFKAPIKVLHPLLTATQEGNYNGTEGLSALPFDGIIIAHSNESEWLSFKHNRNNEAFLDRITITKVPYCCVVEDEIKIYQKMITQSALRAEPLAPQTLALLAQFMVLSRIKEPENSSIYTKMRVYNGENLKDTDPKAKSLQEYRDQAGVNEGMTGLSTRFAYKILARVFNHDSDEIAANPVYLFQVLEQQIVQEQFSHDLQEKYLCHVKSYLIPQYLDFLGKELQGCYFDSFDDYGQELFERYLAYADHWIQNQAYHDPNTGELLDQQKLNEELEKIEKPAGIANPKDFRIEVVNFMLRTRANNKDEHGNWRNYEKLKQVIERKLFANTESILPILSYAHSNDPQTQLKHEQFIARMQARGYTEKQVRTLTDWYLRSRKAL
jgi:serine protein kinase